MKKARQLEQPVFPLSPLDEHDLEVIESLETVLPEERRSKAPKQKQSSLDEKYKPTNTPKF